jgi:hypothetical protein
MAAAMFYVAPLFHMSGGRPLPGGQAPPTPQPAASSCAAPPAAPAVPLPGAAIPQGVPPKGKGKDTDQRRAIHPRGQRREPQGRLTPNRWVGPWNVQGWNPPPPDAGEGQVYKWSYGTPPYVQNVRRYTISGNDIGRNDAHTLGHALSRMLRHDRALPVNRQGFAWISDIVAALAAPPYNLQRRADISDVLWIVARDRDNRFQCVVGNTRMSKTALYCVATKGTAVTLPLK